MSQLTVQQSYLLCWELLPDRNRISMGLWYWELMSHPDPAVLPVGTLHSLEWFWVSRRIFIYSHHNTHTHIYICVFSPRHPSVSVCLSHLFRIILKFSGIITINKIGVHAKGQSKIKDTELETNFAAIWGFPDRNPCLNLQMATKWCTKLELA